MEQWVGSLAVVTGASVGIGAAIAEKLVQAGVNVVGIARRIELVEALSDKLSNESGKLHPAQCDLTDEQQILNTFKWIEETLGPVSILVNNAGIIHATTLSDGDATLWKETFDVNVLAYCICTREAIKSMKNHGIDGIIINVSSVTGHSVPEMATSELLINVYPASKHAVIALGEMLRAELRSEQSKIRISTLSPGIVVTELFRNYPQNEVETVGSIYPMLQSEDVANAALYILSTPPNVQIQELILRPLGEMI
ncbi:hypothetical protein ILUMI_18201 [Ignelater luminosus]|uniref:Farnesol dehydrogenase n=1 Tax=Ignelater luminosus TaxID=2038154 RepID=A0A8K0CMK1_IGNLU|nr:hypothetical protein ILUMI_18201 [Ignelater luminosus]